MTCSASDREGTTGAPAVGMEVRDICVVIKLFFKENCFAKIYAISIHRKMKRDRNLIFRPRSVNLKIRKSLKFVNVAT